MRAKGKITSWNDAKGYGFISPLAGGDRTFVHVKAFANRARRPMAGDIVTYRLSTDTRGRPCAEDVNIAGVATTARPKRPSGLLPQVLALGFLTVVSGAVYLSAIPMPILLVYLLASVTTFAAYAFDKMAAKNGLWRTSESTLHVLALAGGWPGALVAQIRLRHKTRKQPFRTVFWATVLLNCSAFAWLLTPAGEDAWRTMIDAIA